MSDVHLETLDSAATTFGFGEVSSLPPAEEFAAASPPDPPLGALKAFTGTFRGKGFNTIFRPNNRGTATKLPTSLGFTPTSILELNLTEETLSFSPALGLVPNRGEMQGDIFLNGVPYLQVITDITNPGVRSPRIHVEPGLWMILPRTTEPHEPGTLVRMASIPHGTTIAAQGGSSLVTGSLAIPPIDIKPVTPNNDKFPSLCAANNATPRIPQELAPYIAAGTIAQSMLNDPATFIRNHSQHQEITSITKLTVNTQPGHPLFGDGVSNIAFLLGEAQANQPNARVQQMESAFYIETVEYSIQVPAFQPGQPPLVIPAKASVAGQPVPDFLISPPVPIMEPRTIKAAATQIQYAQLVHPQLRQHHLAARVGGHARPERPGAGTRLRLGLSTERRRSAPKRGQGQHRLEGRPPSGRRCKRVQLRQVQVSGAR
jgi:hypothetical protein